MSIAVFTAGIATYTYTTADIALTGGVVTGCMLGLTALYGVALATHAPGNEVNQDHTCTQIPNNQKQ